MRLKLRLALVAAAAAAVPAMAAPAAMAQTTVYCQFSGTASTNPFVQNVGGGGDYGFTQLTFTCEGQADGGAYSGAASLQIATGGTYTNTVCGTGSATSTSGGITATPIEGNLYQAFNGGSVSYKITFVGGEGVLTGSGSGPGGNVTIAGDVSIVPTGGGGTPNTTYCTENFEVAGTALLAAA
jgi:hypothetical protein